MAEYTARAIATLTIEINCQSHWGSGTTMDQVYSQAAQDAIGSITNMATRYGSRVRIIGEPTIKAIIHEKVP